MGDTFGRKNILTSEEHVQDKRCVRCSWIDRPDFNCCACNPVTSLPSQRSFVVIVFSAIRRASFFNLANAPPGGTTYCTSLARFASCAEKIRPVSIMSDTVP